MLISGKIIGIIPTRAIRINGSANAMIILHMEGRGPAFIISFKENWSRIIHSIKPNIKDKINGNWIVATLMRADINKAANPRIVRNTSQIL